MEQPAVEARIAGIPTPGANKFAALLKRVCATVAIAVIGWIAGLTPSLFLAGETTDPARAGPRLDPASGSSNRRRRWSVFGAAQWVVLRRYAQHASQWVWIHGPAWAVAMTAIFLGASLPDVDSPTWFIAAAGALGGAIGGVSLGLITSLVARRLQPLT